MLVSLFARLSLVALASSFAVGCAAPAEEEGTKETTSSITGNGNGNCAIIDDNGKVTKTGDGCDRESSRPKETSPEAKKGTGACSIADVAVGDCSFEDYRRDHDLEGDFGSDFGGDRGGIGAGADGAGGAGADDVEIEQSGSGNCAVVVINGVQTKKGDCKR